MTDTDVLQIQTDDRGCITEPYVHDAYIWGIELAGDDLWLKCKLEDDQHVAIILEGVHDVEANGFWRENVIFDVILVPGRRVDANWVAGIHENLGATDTSLPWFVKLMESIRSRELYYVRVDSSCGMTLAAVCRSVSARRLTNGPDVIPRTRSKAR